MDISAISDLYGAAPAKVSYGSRVETPKNFDSVFQGVMNLLEDTNSLQINAEKEEIAFSLGESQNTHDLMIAQQKANIALQYTVAVRDTVLNSYNTIMNMQI